MPYTMSLVVLLLLVELVGLTVVGLGITWFAKYGGGFALDKTGKEFNLHPVFMALGFLFFNGNSLMTYRILGNNVHRLFAKIVHFLLQLVALICASFGLACVFQFHNANSIPNMYSLHSWLGIATYSFFCLQLLLGLTLFLIMAVFSPNSMTNLRKFYLHFHVYGGVLIFVMAGAASLLGTAEKISFSIQKYSQLPPVAIVANFFGVFTILFVGLVCYVLYSDKFKTAPNTDREYREQINVEQ
ncbi:plasma membrane ascorbate-dependent reductase CYBRD1-like [Asterias amurensis]|uniref:plasma membrane ascorbate-dependent reductase CYBRD1-like n=1 Tax=Asterias amurensis TaxID=7602 RepID=UPI003AB66731